VVEEESSGEFGEGVLVSEWV